VDRAARSATAAAALQTGEVDWLETPLIDLCPMLKKSPGVYTAVVDPGGWLMFMVLNNLNPPLDNPKVRQAIQMALDQRRSSSPSSASRMTWRSFPPLCSHQPCRWRTPRDWNT